MTALARYGPEAKVRSWSLSEARSYCARLTRSHYENFSVASFLLPRRLVPHFQAIYAYCRWADDLGDETGGGSRALALLAWWREELERVYDGTPRHPVMVALRPTVLRFGIPPQPFLDLLIAFTQDQHITRYDTFEQLLGYCRNSANPVGRLVLYLCEAFDEERGRLSDAICTGLQLANFWQDVSRDLDIGRVYLPGEDRTSFGVLESDLAARRCTPAYRELLRFEVDRTLKLFEEGSSLITLVPAEVQADIDLFLQGGLAILRKIEECGYDTLTSRPALSTWDKGTLIVRSLGRRLRQRCGAWLWRTPFSSALLRPIGPRRV